MLFGSQHEDGEDQLCRKEHLDEDALYNFRSSSKRRSYDQRPREQDAYDACTRYGAGYLGNDNEQSAKPGHSSDKTHSKGDTKRCQFLYLNLCRNLKGLRRVEETSRYTEKDPSIDSEREAKTQADVEQLSWVGPLIHRRRRGGLRLGLLVCGLRDLGPGESEE